MIADRIPLAICFLVLAFVLLAPQRWEDRSVAFAKKLASAIFADPLGLLFYFGCLLFATSPAWFFYLARVARQ